MLRILSKILILVIAAYKKFISGNNSKDTNSLLCIHSRKDRYKLEVKSSRGSLATQGVGYFHSKMPKDKKILETINRKVIERFSWFENRGTNNRNSSTP